MYATRLVPVGKNLPRQTMQLTVFSPAQPRHLRDFPVHLKALGFEGFGGVGGQLEGQFPGEQVLAFRFGFKGFVQAFGAVLRQGFALGLRGQGVEGVQLRGHVRMFTQESVQRTLVVITGF